MQQIAWATKVRFYLNVAVLYALLTLCAWYVISPVHSVPWFTLGSTTLTHTVEPTTSPSEPLTHITAGLPTRIVIPRLGIDVPVDKGFYNVDGSWTLSGYHAQFAMLSKLANNHDGNTFIYGHNNKYVFATLKYLNPGDTVAIYTDNQYVFYYQYLSATNVKPNDLSVLQYQGPPELTVQTCSGNWFEWRRMYTFKFEKLVG